MANTPLLTHEVEHFLASAIFEWIEGFYTPVRRHTSIDGHSPVDYEHHHNHAATAA